MVNFAETLYSLGKFNWRVTGTKDPTNEVEFLATFEIGMGVTDDELVWSNDPSDFGVTWSQIATAKDTLESAWETNEYARNRESEYPSQGDQLDMIYKDNLNSTTTHKDAVEAVKTKWPKDNSGPVE